MNSDKNNLRFPDVSLRTAAIAAGVGLLLMTFLAPIANFNILQNLIVSGDAKTTAANIMASEGLFRIGIGCFLITAILDVIVAWGLYVLLRPVNKSLSLLAAWFRVVYAAILAATLINLVGVLQWLSGADYLGAIEPAQLQIQAMVLINTFKVGWDMGLFIFGLHLLLVGYLVFKSGYAPKFLGGLLVIAAAGYLVDGVGKLLFSSYNLTMAMFTFIGEVIFIGWLLWKGVKGFDKSLENRQ